MNCAKPSFESTGRLDSLKNKTQNYEIRYFIFSPFPYTCCFCAGLYPRNVNINEFYYLGKENVVYTKGLVEYRWLITYNDTLPFTYVNRKEYLLIQKKRLEKSVKENPGSEKYVQKYFDRINEYLAKPEGELIQDANCTWNDEERFEGFVEKGKSGSFIAVKPNLSYFKKNLPKSSPQFFTVIYKIEHGDPVFEANIAAIKGAVNFAKLRSMLRK